jgi:hypothetical protein
MTTVSPVNGVATFANIAFDARRTRILQFVFATQGSPNELELERDPSGLIPRVCDQC